MRVEVNKFDTLTKAINAPLLLGDLVMIVTDDIYQYGVIDYYKPLDEWNHPTASGLAIRWLRASDIVETEKNWTVDYNDNGYVSFPPITVKSGESIEFDIVHENGVGWDYILDNRNEGGAVYVTVDTANRLNFSGVKVTLDGEVIPSRHPMPIGMKVSLKVMPVSDQTFSFIGASRGRNESFKGSIYNIKLPNRFYKSLYPTKPTDLVLIDEISGENGTLTNFPAGSEWIEIDTPSPPPIHLFNN